MKRVGTFYVCTDSKAVVFFVFVCLFFATTKQNWYGKENYLYPEV